MTTPRVEAAALHRVHQGLSHRWSLPMQARDLSDKLTNLVKLELDSGQAWGFLPCPVTLLTSECFGLCNRSSMTDCQAVPQIHSSHYSKDNPEGRKAFSTVVSIAFFSIQTGFWKKMNGRGKHMAMRQCLCGIWSPGNWPEVKSIVQSQSSTSGRRRQPIKWSVACCRILPESRRKTFRAHHGTWREPLQWCHQEGPKLCILTNKQGTKTSILSAIDLVCHPDMCSRLASLKQVGTLQKMCEDWRSCISSHAPWVPLRVGTDCFTIVSTSGTSILLLDLIGNPIHSRIIGVLSMITTVSLIGASLICFLISRTPADILIWRATVSSHN